MTKAPTPSTATVTTLDTLATEAATDMPTPPAEALQAAMAAVDAGTNVTDTAAGTLKAITLARYAFHASALAIQHAGKPVLPSNLASAARNLVWRDATGDTVPVPAKERTPSQVSLGQYLSKFGKVATDLAYGVEHLSTVADVETASSEISDVVKQSRENSARILADKAGREYTAWFDALPSGTRAAIKATREAFAAGTPGAEFAPLFAEAIVNAAK